LILRGLDGMTSAFVKLGPRYTNEKTTCLKSGSALISIMNILSWSFKTMQLYQAQLTYLHQNCFSFEDSFLSFTKIFHYKKNSDSLVIT
ncbi:hypothetical protein ACJX0J_037214, partial [Zea mays]